MVQTILLALMFMKPNPAKLLTATYESEMKTDSAWIYLQQIPDDNAENTAFKELYTLLLNGIDPPAGSGKAMSMQELYLRQSAIQEQMAYAPIAQAINASYFGETYYKNVGNLRSNDGGIASQLLNEMHIYPNPASNTTTIHLKPQTEQLWQLHIYDLQGFLLRTYLCSGNVFVLPIDLPNGMYICKATVKTQIIAVQKMFVLK